MTWMNGAEPVPVMVALFDPMITSRWRMTSLPFDTRRSGPLKLADDVVVPVGPPRPLTLRKSPPAPAPVVSDVLSSRTNGDAVLLSRLAPLKTPMPAAEVVRVELTA